MVRIEPGPRPGGGDSLLMWPFSHSAPELVSVQRGLTGGTGSDAAFRRRAR